jgi:signal peptidase II
MRRRYAFFISLSLVLVVADQATKWWAATELAERRVERARPACDEDGPIERRVRYRAARTVDVIDGLFSLRYVENCAGAFGILQEQDESIRRPFFLVVTFAAVIFIVVLFHRLQPEQRLLMWALPFVLGGAVGNLIDRVHLRYVIDFIDWYHASIGRWPTFNIADAAIVVGVALILLDMIPFRANQPSTDGRPERPAEKARSTAGDK